MAELNNTEIGFEKEIWKAADLLRGNLDASEYKSVVLGLIFLKYISDRFESKYETLLGEGDGFEEDKDEYTSENIFFVPQEARWSVVAQAAHSPEIGIAIDNAMRLIEKENIRLKGVLPKNFARPELDKRRLGDVVDLFTNIKMKEHGDRKTYLGEMEIVEDEAVKRSLWGDWMLDHFRGGVEDPEYCVLKFTPKSATYWIDNAFVKDDKYQNLYCQSCGMPMQTADQFGTNADGTLNQDYCCYCYKDGAFVQDCTMDEMIDHCIKFLDEFNGVCDTKLSKEEAIAQMRKHFPTLKRWAK